MEAGIALLDAGGRKLHANRAALEMRAAAGTPSGPAWQEDGRRQRAAARATGERVGKLERKGNRPLLVRAIMLEGGRGEEAAAKMAPLWHDPSRPRPAAVLGASGALGVTPRECEIGGLLACRQGTHEIASVLGISVGNLRVHLKHIFAKAGVRGRVALVALLHRAS